MATSGSSPASLPILDGKNYCKWCIQMRVLLAYQEVLEIVSDGVEALPENSNDDQRLAHKEATKKDRKALFLIHQCVDSGNFDKISSANSFKEAWDILNKSYAGADKVKRVRLQSLRREYENLVMEENETAAAYFTRFQTLVNLMKNCGETFTELQLVEKVLRSLTQKFDYIVCAIEESKDLSDLKMDDLQSSIEAHEQRLNARIKDKAPAQALQAHSNRSYPGESSKFKKNKWKANK